MWKKRISPGERVPLKLTPTETKAILGDLMCLDREYEQLIQEAPAGKPVMMTLDDLEDFGGYIAAEANHTEDKRLGRKLDRVFDKCQRLLNTYTDEPDDTITAEQAKQKLTKGINDAPPGKEPAIISFRLKSKTPKSAKFPIKITQHQRDSLLRYTQLKVAIKKRVESAEEGTQIIEFTKKELDHIQDETGHAVVYARSPHKQRLVAIQKKVDDILEEIRLEDFGFERPKQLVRAHRAHVGIIAQESRRAIELLFGLCQGPLVFLDSLPHFVAPQALIGDLNFVHRPRFLERFEKRDSSVQPHFFHAIRLDHRATV